MAKFSQRLALSATLIVCVISGVKAQIVERPVVSGRQAVVTTDEPLASMAGMLMLQQGGNAFDAAVAAAIAVGVLDPRMGSIGGNGFARCAQLPRMERTGSIRGRWGTYCEGCAGERGNLNGARSSELSRQMGDANQHDLSRLYGIYPAAEQQRDCCS
jgi:Gamma-glutamyltranspeptidase